MKIPLRRWLSWKCHLVDLPLVWYPVQALAILHYQLMVRCLQCMILCTLIDVTDSIFFLMLLSFFFILGKNILISPEPLLPLKSHQQVITSFGKRCLKFYIFGFKPLTMQLYDFKKLASGTFASQNFLSKIYKNSHKKQGILLSLRMKELRKLNSRDLFSNDLQLLLQFSFFCI